MYHKWHHNIISFDSQTCFRIFRYFKLIVEHTHRNDLFCNVCFIWAFILITMISPGRLQCAQSTTELEQAVNLSNLKVSPQVTHLSVQAAALFLFSIRFLIFIYFSLCFIALHDFFEKINEMKWNYITLNYAKMFPRKKKNISRAIYSGNLDSHTKNNVDRNTLHWFQDKSDWNTRRGYLDLGSITYLQLQLPL